LFYAVVPVYKAHQIGDCYSMINIKIKKTQCNQYICFHIKHCI